MLPGFGVIISGSLSLMGQNALGMDALVFQAFADLTSTRITFTSPASNSQE
jgi:hypothetical protein